MHYYYDILANLDQCFWNFYEWEQTDPIVVIKKIPLVRVHNKDIIHFLSYNVCFDPLWVEKYLEKTIIKEQKNKANCILFSSARNALILEFSETGKVLSRSRLLLEDENNCNEIAYSLKEVHVPYELKERLFWANEFRQALKEKKLIQVELNTLQDTNNITKCSFLYYEWFGEMKEDIKEMILRMQGALLKDYTMKIHYIAKLIHLSYKERL